MARTKHNKTKNGTHRERVLRYRQELAAFRKAAAAEAMKKMIFANTQQTLTDSSFAETQPVVEEAEIESRIVDIQPDPVKDDGFGHGLEDQSLADTMREFNGMVNHDKHEQVMDTFVEEAKSE